MTAPNPQYRGRFAPSPTGPLHLGSLIAALASYLDARSAGGQWLLRMEDLDPPREEPGAAESILASLRDHGLHWDGDVLWQSRRHDAYAAALDQLNASGALFRCDCTRAMLGPGGACAGRCANRQAEITGEHALRLRVEPRTEISFSDRLQGEQREDLHATLPDFVLRRKDGLYAYQLAVVVDDAFQGVNQVVRGSDLLDSTARQIYLQQCLGVPRADYLHLPVITNSAGQKFSKQNHAPALDAGHAADNLRAALAFLGQVPAPAGTITEILEHAVAHWSVQRLPRGMALPADALPALYRPGGLA
ncbi:tRNA glutamyl-Q(34) synthetase GluQRS [Mangrovimicrobium sediminis]|uniref:Glutamyl-Q tRNA(Asp) synthetase n=1 Tax=Mangrovimicrobium sediminis TaxID=2562682 RepID=A0A4Z0LUN8_9GAMM|nr:tRNA glutamyl-Q(34) synthetase GluQRS [Haliea sp. SAOS-164]TGD70927.1 tRNA glutamyl-Q(34) synthetase GluQRS [Haliea sp. SAOS-164]